VPQPGDADPLPHAETVDAVAERDHLAHDLVARRHAGAVHGQVALGHVQIRAADGTRPYP
jgi:hypothetical protein